MRNGFSLLELSIVLVIIGLLAGGVMTGQALIRAAELRSIVTDYTRLTSARHAFRDKYQALPGDMRSATQFWGRAVAATDCVTNSSAAVLAPGTCDGDGDGILAMPTAASKSGETFQAWKQLALAGMVEGSYSGIAGTGSYCDFNYGTNAPASKISNIGWGLGYLDNSGGSASTIIAKRDYRNSLSIGTDDGMWADGEFLRTEEAWNIDQKLDDGRPTLGIVTSYPIQGNCANATSITDTAATYNLSSSTQNACALLFSQ